MTIYEEIKYNIDNCLTCALPDTLLNSMTAYAISVHILTFLIPTWPKWSSKYQIKKSSFAVWGRSDSQTFRSIVCLICSLSGVPCLPGKSEEMKTFSNRFHL